MSLKTAAVFLNDERTDVSAVGSHFTSRLTCQDDKTTWCVNHYSLCPLCVRVAEGSQHEACWCLLEVISLHQCAANYSVHTNTAVQYDVSDRQQWVMEQRKLWSGGVRMNIKHILLNLFSFITTGQQGKHSVTQLCVLCTVQTQRWGQWSVSEGFGCCRSTPRWRGLCQPVWIWAARSSATSPPAAWSTAGLHPGSEGCTRTGCSLCRPSRTLRREGPTTSRMIFGQIWKQKQNAVEIRLLFIWILCKEHFWNYIQYLIGLNDFGK